MCGKSVESIKVGDRIRQSECKEHQMKDGGAVNIIDATTRVL